jgi:hypothetical protein
MTGSSIRKRQCALLPALFYVVNDYLKFERDYRDKLSVLGIDGLPIPETS